MWPLDRASVRDLVRVGRHAVERWSCEGKNLSLLASQLLPTTARPQDLAAPMRALFTDEPRAKVTLIVESAWLPLLLADTGGTLVARTQVEALVRHRFDILYGDGVDPVSAWELRVEHRAGDRFALAYGLSPQLKYVLLETGRSLGLEWAALSPALAWGRLRALSVRSGARQSGWWLWPEQDRTIITRLQAGCVTGLNAGAPPVADARTVGRLVDAEAVRLGWHTGADTTVAATWALA